MPTHLSVYIPDNREDLAEFAKKKADTIYRGKCSPYILDLIEKDANAAIDGALKLPPAEDENFFIELCEMFAGYAATARAKKSFKQIEKRISQRAFLEHILRRASIAAAWLAKHPDAEFDGFRFHHSNEYSETHKSPSSTSLEMSNVI